MFFKTVLLKNFPIFTAKHLCWSLFLIKLQVRRRLRSDIFKNSFLTEHFCWLLLEVTVQNRITSFCTVTFSACGGVFRIFPESHFWNHTYEKSNRSVFENMNLVFSLAACANSLVVSFPFKYMFLVFEPRMRKLILNHVTGNNCPEFRNGLLGSYFFKLALEMDFLELCFRRVALKTILTQ